MIKIGVVDEATEDIIARLAKRIKNESDEI